MRPGILVLVLSGLWGLAVGCTSGLPDPVKLDSPGGTLDLRTWNFSSGGPVIPQGWLWDAGVLWSPESGGRPGTLSPSESLGPPDHGGSLGRSLHDHPGTIARATAWLTILVSDRQNFALQIGALPGASKVWVNGIPVAESRSGLGAVLSVQPREGRLEIVTQLVTENPLVRHSELNRFWILGPAQPLLASEQAERDVRTFQATFLFLGILVFLGMAFLRSHRRTFLPFAAYLVVCLFKLLVNVEQVEPLMAPVWPWISPSVYLFLNHGLNLLPFPLMVLFLVRLFPEDVSFFSFLVVTGATFLAEVWELLPFVALAGGRDELYTVVMQAPWSFVLNLYVVIVVLFIFERFYQIHTQRRPMSGAFFFGGISIGLIILLPIPLSYFLPVKYTLFLGTGMFFFLLILGSALILQQVKLNEDVVQRLTERLDRREILGRFLSQGWGHRLGHESAESLRPGDRGSAETVLVQIHSADPAELWLPIVGKVAETRHALLVDWRGGTGLWVLDSWPETALAFSLEVQKELSPLPGLRYRIVLTKALVDFRVLDTGSSWLPTVNGIPWGRLAELDERAEHYGAVLVLDAALKEGLVVGGWRRHRPMTVSGTEIELYEAEEESLAQIKDQTMDLFETALSQAREGRIDQAIQAMVRVVRQDPFDRAALAFLAEWGTRSP